MLREGGGQQRASRKMASRAAMSVVSLLAVAIVEPKSTVISDVPISVTVNENGALIVGASETAPAAGSGGSISKPTRPGIISDKILYHFSDVALKDHNIIVVDSVIDVIDDGDAAVASTRCKYVHMASKDDAVDKFLQASVGGGVCSLRAALTLAANEAANFHFTIALRPGRYRVKHRLPEVIGSVQIVGSADLPDMGQSSTAGGQPADDQPQPDFLFGLPSQIDMRKKPHVVVEAGQSSAIATVLDGGGKVQLLRIARGASLHVRSVRFKGGRALRNDATDPRDVIGGAICNLGKLMMNNVAIIGCKAAYGGGIYNEGQLLINSSRLERNEATRCGGFIYTSKSHRHGAHFEFSNLGYNKDACGHADEDIAQKIEPAKALPNGGTMKKIGGGQANTRTGVAAPASGILKRIIEHITRSTDDIDVMKTGVISNGPPLSELFFGPLSDHKIPLP